MENTVRLVLCHDLTLGRDLPYHRVEQIGDISLFDLVLVAGSILGARQLLTEAMQAEAVVNTLTQNTAESRIALQNQNIALARVVGRNSRRHTRRAAADDYEIDLLRHTNSSFVIRNQIRYRKSSETR